MKPIEIAYKKCEKIISTCRNTSQLNCGYKIVKQFGCLYKNDKNFNIYLTLLSATLHIKSQELK